MDSEEHARAMQHHRFERVQLPSLRRQTGIIKRRILIFLGIAASLGALGYTLDMVAVYAGGLTIPLLVVVYAFAQLKTLRDIEEPLLDLTKHLHQVEQGNFEASSPINSTELLSELGNAFDRITASLLLARNAVSDRDQLQAILDGVPDPLVVLDGNGVVEWSNQRFDQELQFDESLSLLGRGVGTLAGQNLPNWYMSLIRHGELVNEPVSFKTKDQKDTTLSVSGTMIENQESGRTQVVLLARNPNEKHSKSGDSATQSHQDDSRHSEFQNLFDAIEDPITVLALNGEILQANRAARSMFGHQIVGKRCFRAFRMRDSMCEQCPAKMTYERRKSAFVEHRIFGNAITRINTYPLFDAQGEVRAIINHKRDVTMERQLEDLKANFLAAVSHELRTPLTSIIGFNKLNLKRMTRHLAPQLESSPHKVRVTFRQIIDDMQVMVAESERLGRLVNDILDLSKLEAGRMDLEFGEIDLHQTIQSAIASTSALWREKGLRVECQSNQSLPKCWGDSDRLIQVLMNLLSNAIKFTKEGEIVISTTKSRWHVCVSVKDTGPGIPLEAQKTIFEKFRQTSEGTKQGGGTGLGLPICREFIQLHRGKLWVDSVPGEGATFSFTIPRADRRDEVEREQEARTSFSGQWNRSDLDFDV